MFRIEDPYKLLLLCLLVGYGWINLEFHFSRIDIALVGIWIYDMISWGMHPLVGMDSLYRTTICFIGYLLLRNMRSEKQSTIFLKAFCFPSSIALCITLIAFVIFKDAIHIADFKNIYPFRFLFRPLGYVTNVWSSVLLFMLGIFTIGYFKVVKWRFFFSLLWICCSIAILLSFSRGAYIAWGSNVIIMLLLFDTWRKRLYFFVICLCIGGTIALLFPVETSTTCSMNKTILQRQSTKSRLTATESAIRAFPKNKWLGAGNGNYLLIVDKDLNQDSTQAYTSYAPNIIVQIMIEKGLMGLGIYIFLLTVVILSIWRQRHHTIVLVIGGVVLSVCVKELTMSVMLTDYLVLFLMYLLLAFLQMEQNCEQNLCEKQPAKPWKFILLISGGLCFAGCEIYTLRHFQNESYNQMSINAFNKGNYSEAIDYLEHTSQQTPYLINRVMLGINLPDSLFANYKACIEHSLELLKQDNKEDVYTIYLQTRILERKGKNDIACNILDSLVNAFPNNAVFCYELFSLLSKRGRISEALPYLKKSLVLLPRLIHVQRVRLLRTAVPHFFQEIIQDLISQQENSARSPDWYARCGYLAYCIGNDRIAQTWLNQSIKEQSNFAIPWLLLGKLHEKKESKEEADNCFRKYNLLTKGAFSNSTDEVNLSEVSILEQKILFWQYAMKIQDRYYSNLLF